MQIMRPAVVWSLAAGLAGCGDPVLLGGVSGSAGGPGPSTPDGAAGLSLDAADEGRSSGAGSGDGSSSAAGSLDATIVDASAATDVEGTEAQVDAASASPPSCAAGGDGLTNCGPNAESCCTSLEVAGGTFYRTYRNNGTGPTGEADPATVSDFLLDKYDVTVGRFRQFVDAVLPPNGTGWLPPPGSGKHTHLNAGLGLVNTVPDAGVAYETGWLASDDIYIAPTATNLACDAYATWTPSPAGNETRPVTCVDWFEAYAFCIWDGAFLPSDAEWEYAAAGGTDQREYPWGTTDPGTANLYAIFGDAQNGGSCYYPTGTLTRCTGPMNIAPVGTAYLGAGRWGQVDFEGNIEQWVLDWSVYYDPSVDGADLTGGLNRSLRGTSFDVANGGLGPWETFAAVPVENTLPYRAGGFRCARPPAEAAPLVDAGPTPEAGAIAPTAPSCAAGGAGRTTCGPGSDDCCTSLEVTGGTFYRSYTNDGTGPTGEANPATVSTFLLDKYDVTVGRFREFRDAVLPPDGGVGWTPPPGSGKHTHLNGGLGLAVDLPEGGTVYESGWLASDDGQIAPTSANLACGNIFYPTWTDAVGSHENLPIDCLNWYEAYAFCIWDGGFLPSQAEWEYAAAGGGEQREYPWGSAPPGTASQYAVYGCNYPTPAGACSSVQNIAPVGMASLGAGLWGQLDLASNVSEWILDWFPAAGPSDYIDPCTDCVNATPSPYRTTEGCSFYQAGLVPLTPSGSIGQTGPTTRGADVGFRCARSPAGVVGPHSGVLDTTFGGTGFVTWLGPPGTPLPESVGRGVVVDYSSVGSAAGRVVIAGTVHGADGLSRMAAWRITPDGAFDSTFGSAGTWVVPEPPDAGASYVGAEGEGLVVDDTGRPRVAGTFDTVNPQNPIVYGLTSGGVLDTTYGQGGSITPPAPAGGQWRWGYGIALDGSQNIIVGGAAVTPSGGVDLAIGRFTPGGVADSSFGAGGASFLGNTASGGATGDAAPSSSSDIVNAVAIVGDTVVAVGTSVDATGITKLAIWRFNTYVSPGTLDATFNGTGYVVLSSLAGDTSAFRSDDGQAVAVDSSSGLIYFAGYASAAGGANRGFVGRLTTSGSLDPSFGSGGLVLLAPLPEGDAGSAPSSYAAALALDQESRVVVAGSVNDGFNTHASAWRLSNAGVPDGTFGDNGVFVMTAGGNSAQGLALDEQGGAVLVGSSLVPSGGQALAVWRLTP